MLRLYTRFIGNAVQKRNFQLRKTEQSRIITQFTRNYGDGNYKHAPCIARRLGFLSNFFFCIMISDPKSKFAISEEALDGRPLYLDAQATTPLVSMSTQLCDN